MCCFSGHVERVSDTKIFARRCDGEQCLVYEMRFSSRADLAMVLPIPVPPASREEAVRFVSFEAYPEFFRHLDRLFLQRVGRAPGMLGILTAVAPTLKVHDVGAFEASFVPGIADFERLDPRFRLPKDVWPRLPLYRDWGFAVFKLKAGRRQRVHPMALCFPTREAQRLFFPTVHVHDGTVRGTADFDHALYAQTNRRPSEDWLESRGAPREVMELERCSGVVEADAPCWKLELIGRRKNEDVLVAG